MSNKDNKDNKDNKEKKHPMLDPTLCKELKERHDACFNKWYTTAFLKGNATMECVEEWEEYQVCIKIKIVQKKKKFTPHNY
ncbi:hypothetical protein DDB_G0287279 [Dictyostelium discoideum AX4]|uniref:Uncharacterized protein n=1 Tax=Dictyostelium discoideum TaxID=44689 RepID=Q54KL1_DICDI|nr:hypothetical protein DDB_G0287279 [Dictyostelium discoideum AX4]EAL63801.1 hypothetical protein DDB_G0287279 [Dictyostelium discoideum AX4]|eukprot:XP_637306.1 hypothetical protein DDB_G0287279 [Dictyostelium discoideum AX4]